MRRHTHLISKIWDQMYPLLYNNKMRTENKIEMTRRHGGADRADDVTAYCVESS